MPTDIKSGNVNGGDTQKIRRIGRNCGNVSERDGQIRRIGRKSGMLNEGGWQIRRIGRKC
jgi:hypothetical protein